MSDDGNNRSGGGADLRKNPFLIQPKDISSGALHIKSPSRVIRRRGLLETSFSSKGGMDGGVTVFLSQRLEQTNHHWTCFCTHILVLIGSHGCSGKRQGPSQVKQKVSPGFTSPEL